MIRVMVTGSRDWRDVMTIGQAIDDVEMFNPNEHEFSLVNGCASGADAIARSWAFRLGWKLEDYWPDYVKYDFATANKTRNIEMVDSAPTCVYAFPTTRSRGTWHAVNYAKQQGYVENETLWIYAEQ